MGGVGCLQALQYYQLEAEWSEQLENLERESHTRGASSENEAMSKGSAGAVHLLAPLICRSEASKSM